MLTNEKHDIAVCNGVGVFKEHKLSKCDDQETALIKGHREFVFWVETRNSSSWSGGREGQTQL